MGEGGVWQGWGVAWVGCGKGGGVVWWGVAWIRVRVETGNQEVGVNRSLDNRDGSHQGPATFVHMPWLQPTMWQWPTYLHRYGVDERPSTSWE